MAQVIGITGGIGSGKSTVANILSEKLSAPVLDADKIAKDAMRSPEIIKKIKDFFGYSIFDNPEIIDSKRLANIVFSNEEKLIQLNAIVHPYVMEQIINMIAALSITNNYIILDVPLPNDSFISACNKIITVTAPEEIRINRVAARSGLTHEDVIKRIKKQLPQEKYIELSDIVIKNDSTIEKLSDEINKIKF